MATRQPEVKPDAKSDAVEDQVSRGLLGSYTGYSRSVYSTKAQRGHYLILDLKYLNKYLQIPKLCMYKEENISIFDVYICYLHILFRAFCTS